MSQKYASTKDVYAFAVVDTFIKRIGPSDILKSKGVGTTIPDSLIAMAWIIMERIRD